MADQDEVLLDLLNTTPLVDGCPTDTLTGAWLRSHGAVGESLSDVRRLRTDLQRVVRGDAAPATLARHLDGASQTPVISGGALGWNLKADWAARMVLAWGTLQNELPGRLRPCANDECHLFLLDRSRPGTARWCSMAGCGNRMKARRHYRRTESKG